MVHRIGTTPCEALFASDLQPSGPAGRYLDADLTRAPPQPYPNGHGADRGSAFPERRRDTVCPAFAPVRGGQRHTPPASDEPMPERICRRWPA